MTTPDQIYEAIRVLPVHERLVLLERVAHDLAERAAMGGRSGAASPTLKDVLLAENGRTEDLVLPRTPLRRRRAARLR
jgi:hypothetical protein